MQKVADVGTVPLLEGLHVIKVQVYLLVAFAIITAAQSTVHT